jgi:hypothetical protein
MTELQQKMTEFLEETITYYSENPVERRCVSKNGSCWYSPVAAKKSNSQGCAIGRKMSEEQQKKILELGINPPVEFLPRELIPESLHIFPSVYLIKIQSLHDVEQYWDYSGLTVQGKVKVRDIKHYITGYEG